MIAKIKSLLLLASIVVLAGTGCRGCMRENLIYEHTFNRPDCGSKPCPVECAEFELPPGGPYIQTPAGVGGAAGSGMITSRGAIEK